MKIRSATPLSVIIALFICVLLNGCETGDFNLKEEDIGIEGRRGLILKAPQETKLLGQPICEEIIGSKCTADQEEYLKHFFWRLENVVTMPPIATKEVAPPLEFLPKDQFGYTNWTKSAIEGLISPQDSLIWGKDKEEEKPFDLLVFFQARVPLMADVVFPHAVHNYWLSCRNCHPKIFKPLAGGNPVSMKAIREGKYCGKCHGKVAFPIDPPVEQCRRCHAFFKR